MTNLWGARPGGPGRGPGGPGPGGARGGGEGGLTNERPGIWSCDLWANERPQKNGKKTKINKKKFLAEMRTFFFSTNERPGIWSCDLWANERPKKKLHGEGTDTQTHRQTNKQTDIATL